jgi:hypothetical protein
VNFIGGSGGAPDNFGNHNAFVNGGERFLGHCILHAHEAKRRGRLLRERVFEQHQQLTAALGTTLSVQDTALIRFGNGKRHVVSVSFKVINESFKAVPSVAPQT